MNVIEIQKDFNWVVKVLESCINLEQIDPVTKLFDNFLKKWKDELSNEMVLKLTNTFDRLLFSHKIKIKKNLLSKINYN